MLKTINANMIKPRSINSTTHVMAISEDGVKRNKTFHPKGKVKGKVGQSHPNPNKVNYDITHVSGPNETIYFYCHQKGHWKRSYLKYPKEIMKNKASKIGTSNTYMIELHSALSSDSWILDIEHGNHIFSNVQD